MFVGVISILDVRIFRTRSRGDRGGIKELDEEKGIAHEEVKNRLNNRLQK